MIRARWNAGTRHFVVRSMGRPEQYIERSRDAVLSQAVRFARRLRVRAWLTDDDHNFTLIEDGRISRHETPPGL